MGECCKLSVVSLCTPENSAIQKLSIIIIIIVIVIIAAAAAAAVVVVLL